MNLKLDEVWFCTYAWNIDGHQRERFQSTSPKGVDYHEDLAWDREHRMVTADGMWYPIETVQRMTVAKPKRGRPPKVTK